MLSNAAHNRGQDRREVAATVQRERTQDREKGGKETEERKGANEARKPAETYKSIIICSYFCL